MGEGTVTQIRVKEGIDPSAFQRRGFSEHFTNAFRSAGHKVADFVTSPKKVVEGSVVGFVEAGMLYIADKSVEFWLNTPRAHFLGVCGIGIAAGYNVALIHSIAKHEDILESFYKGLIGGFTVTGNIEVAYLALKYIPTIADPATRALAVAGAGAVFAAGNAVGAWLTSLDR